MAEEKKVEEVKKEETPSIPTPTNPEKKKSNTVLYVVIGVIVFLGVLTVAGFFVVKGLINKGVDTLEDSVNLFEEVSDEDADSDSEQSEDEEDGDQWLYKASTEEKVDGDLEKDNLVSSKFPSDIPLCGGVVTGSSYDEWTLETKIETASEVEEVLAWYVDALQEEGWEITSQTSDEVVEGYATASVDFASTDGERKGEVRIETSPFYQVSLVTVQEILY